MRKLNFEDKQNIYGLFLQNPRLNKIGDSSEEMIKKLTLLGAYTIWGAHTTTTALIKTDLK
jgi:hypothetical protein